MVSLDPHKAARAALALETERRRAKLDYTYFLDEVLGIKCRYTAEPAVRRYLTEFGHHLNDWLHTRHATHQDGTLVQNVPRKVMIIVPRKTFKSSGITQGCIPYSVVNDPDLVCGVMCASYEDLAIPIAKNIRSHFEGESSSSRIRALYGDFKKPDEWSASNFTVAQRDAALRDPTVSAYGVRKGVVGHHFDLFVIDDPVTNEAMSNNSDWLDRAYRSWVDLKAALNPNALVVLVMTRYHDADLAGRIIQTEIKSAAEAALGTLPDWNPDDPAIVKKYAHYAGWHVIYEQAVSGLGTDSPVYNFPGIWGEQRIQEVRAGKTIDGDEESEEYNELFFWCQLQNTPQKREDNPIQQQHLDIAVGMPPWRLEQAPRTGYVDFHCDFAFKSAEAYIKQKGDVGVMHVTVPCDGFIWRVNGYRGKVTQDMFGEEIIRMATWARNVLKARVRYITYDKLTGQGSGDQSTEKWIQNLFYRHPNLNMPICLPIPRVRGKAEYIMGTAWAWQEGWVRLCTEAPGIAQLTYQMSRIGYTQHDDDADAFASSLHPDVYKTTARVTGPDDDLWDWQPAVSVTGGEDFDEFDHGPGVWAGGF